MIGARVINLAIGLIAIPVLIRYLGGGGFAAWALLLALGAGFSILEMGMPTAIVRFLAVPTPAGPSDAARTLVFRAWLLLALSFLLGTLAVALLGERVAAWLGLPDSQLLTARQAILCVFGFVAARAFLQTGALVMLARGRFVAASAVSLLQPLSANFAAMVVAWQWRRLDLALIAYWTAQCAVLAVALFVEGRAALPKLGREPFNWKKLVELWSFGLASQMEAWAHFVNFQFDKFLVAGWVGLWGVAPYEVANRAVAALRSLPASGAESFLPMAAARHADRDAAWGWYLSSTHLVAYGVIVFMLAPLAVSPVFLYAWTGEMGYLGRWVFVVLCIGAMASVLALPAATLMQAAGRADVPGRAALLAVFINAVLSLLLIGQWGMVGAAAGTALAMVAAAGRLGYITHRHFDRPVGPTLRMLASLWMPILMCLTWGVLTYALFTLWFGALAPAERYSRETRLLPALVALGGYATLILCIAGVEFLRGRFPVGLSPRRFRATVLGMIAKKLS